ncbi:CPBP family intramembrane glutamic endopeptidase [Rugosimonospora africana]|uniref:CAAX prenyl protease 2/Lysostaphin resistance protein A-like domain-containing protein n=1 Tax=Rugosimonospora africana TaxID=556532 RepID=A0A8J3VVG9_9ACTN|nr:CPBP family intramembrane glutamic endopeptidase [Rugosimonospora africana]GIH20260.1 hypothetical protein Raf01_84320 [Rugosimonospora africana]
MTVALEPRSPQTVEGYQRFGWFGSLVRHVTPSAVTFAAALALKPLIVRLGLPANFSLSVAFALLLTPTELTILLIAARRATGRWSPRALPAVLAFRRPLRRWALLVPPLFGVALLAAVASGPVSDALAAHLGSVYPHWLLPDYDATAGFSRPVLVVTMLVTLAVDGITNPIVEELYFRAYLLPRLPLSGWAAVPVSAALFTVQHYWQPWNWPLIFVLELILTTLVVRLRSYRIGIVMHCLANSFGILVALLGVLT